MKKTDPFILKGVEGYCTAIQAMIDGLKYQSSRPDFKVDMKTYGRMRNGICFGCAATCALQQLAYIDIDATNAVANDIEDVNDGKLSIVERTKLYGCSSTWVTVDRLEYAFDRFRVGDVRLLMAYCKIDKSNMSIINSIERPAFRLSTYKYREQLPLVETYLKKVMKKFDLEF